MMNLIKRVHLLGLFSQPEKIENTHQRMGKAYHPDGGTWHRSYMPRTTFVFINAQEHLTPEQQREAAHEEAKLALGEYWKALEGTLDPQKVSNAAENALIGNPQDIIDQAKQRFHPDDRLMLWFDFFNHDSKRVIENMGAFMEFVAPHLQEKMA